MPLKANAADEIPRNENKVRKSCKTSIDLVYFSYVSLINGDNHDQCTKINTLVSSFFSFPSFFKTNSLKNGSSQLWVWDVGHKKNLMLVLKNHRRKFLSSFEYSSDRIF